MRSTLAPPYCQPKIEPIIFCSLSMELVQCATRMELFFMHTKLVILVYSNKPNSKRKQALIKIRCGQLVCEVHTPEHASQDRG
jgi:hypothetical protein